MSYATITRASNDPSLRNRIQGCVNQECQGNATAAASPFGKYCLDQPWLGYQALLWPVAVAVEAQYEYGINAGNADPGGDPAVITDGAILSAVQSHWPTEVPSFLPPITPI